MKKITLDELSPYDAAGHFNVTALRLCGKEETGAEKFWVGLSHFLPGGGAEYKATLTEKYYFVLDGEITVNTDKEEVTLGPWESVYIAPNEGRSILNKTNKPASILVIVNY
jgi:glyoxylate utilization-related uncharacterized protein